MPIYEYKCLDCDTRVEKIQKVADAPLETCEKCGGRLEKQVSLSGFQFKGAGWYVTDYAKKSGVAGAPGADKSEKSEKTESSEKTSTAESTAKTESASNSSNETKSTAKTETVSKKE